MERLFRGQLNGAWFIMQRVEQCWTAFSVLGNRFRKCPAPMFCA